MDRLGSLNRFDNFKRGVLALQALEQSRATAEHHRDEVDGKVICGPANNNCCVLEKGFACSFQAYSL